MMGAETGELKKGREVRGWGCDADGAGNRIGWLCALICRKDRFDERGFYAIYIMCV